MKYHYDVSITLRGVECTATEIEIQSAEPDVGIMSDYPEGYSVIVDETQEDITESLTEDERERVETAITEHCVSNRDDAEDF